MTTSGPSSNWLALQKSLGHSRKRLSDATPAFRRNTASLSSTRHDPDSTSKHIDLETTELRNGESIAALRNMVLGKVEYKAPQTAPGKYLALDCEMVGVGIEGNESSLARVSIVNYTGAVILDIFVRQRERVVDYRTKWSGVRSTDLVGSAKPFKDVQQAVADLIKDRILVGHAVYNDLKALLLSHPSPQIRDTQSLAYKHRVVKSRRPALRVLVKQELGIVIQGGEHNSVTDARATMALFRLYKKQWESGFRPSHKVGHSQRRDKADDDPASNAIGLTLLSPSLVSSPMRGWKRKHSDSYELDDDDVDGVVEASSPSSRARAHSLSSSSAPHTRAPTQHISTSSKRKQRSKSQPPANSGQREGISSGISTVTRRTGRIKEVLGKGARTGDDDSKGSLVGNSSKGGKKTGKVGEKWWKSLGGGKKGSIKL